MEILASLGQGFAVALTPVNLFYCFLGIFIGTLIGVLPGIGLIMLAGIYYGSMYGGSTTSILVNIPGEAASVITCLDGYQMARKGRAGSALGMAAIASFIAGTVSLFGLLFLAPTFANFALEFSSPEFVSLILC